MAGCRAQPAAFLYSGAVGARRCSHGITSWEHCESRKLQQHWAACLVPQATESCCCMQVVDVGLMAKAMEFCATTEACHNQAFNLSNGDVFRWSEVPCQGRLANLTRVCSLQAPWQGMPLHQCATTWLERATN